MFSPVVIPAYLHWLMAGMAVALILAGTIVSIRWRFRGLCWLYGAVAVLVVIRFLTVKVPLVVGPLLVPPVLVLLVAFAIISWTLATLLRPQVVRFCAKKN